MPPPSAADLAERAIGRLSPWTGMERCWRRQAPSEPVMQIVDELVSEGDVVVDIGAAYGLFTAHLARLVGPEGHVHAFEPDPVKVRRLRSLRRGREWITIHPRGLSDRSAQTELHVPVLGGRRLREQAFVGAADRPGAGACESHRVSLERMDAVLGEQPLQFVKCDAEGHELPALRGAERILRRWRPRLLVEVEQRHHREPISLVLDAISGFGYEGFALRGEELVPITDFDVVRDQTSLLGEGRDQAVPPEYVNNFVFKPS